MNVEEIRVQALEIVAREMQNDDIPPAKRADMALALLGKAAIKEGDQPAEPISTEPVEIVFRIVDARSLPEDAR